MRVIEKGKDPEFEHLPKIIESRQENEKQMAEQLLVAFERSEPILTLLRNHVKVAARQIIRLCDLKGGDVVFRKAYQDAKNYDWVVAGRHDTYQKFRSFLRDETHFNAFGASQCSDIIRFFGEITEAAADFPRLAKEWIEKDIDSPVKSELLAGGPREEYEIYKLGKQAVATQKSYQRAGGVPVNPWGTTFGMTPDKSHWGKSEAAGGRRLRVSTAEEPQWLPEKKRLETGAEREERMRIVRTFRAQQTKCEHAIVEMKAGVSRWMQLDNDTTNKMNLVFGLAHGATISGTTADTLYFFDQVTAGAEFFGKMLPFSQRLHRDIIEPLCYMLPLATIVGKGHHSTIEVALPLNLNLKDRFAYSIGRYKTLKPVGLGDRWGNEIDIILAAAQANASQSLVLVYYKEGGREPEGYVKCDPDSVWDELARGDAALLARFRKMPPFPTKRDIASLHLKVYQALFKQEEDRRTFQQKRAFWEDRARERK